MNKYKTYDVVIIGAGAAGLMCAMRAGSRGKRVLLLDHAPKIGSKILISGGGRCNFTNRHISADQYISENQRFCLSALKSYTQHDFLKLIEKHSITYHEKTLGQLFCDSSAKQLVDMLETECLKVKVDIKTNCTINKINNKDGFSVQTNIGSFKAQSLVLATGGLSIPKIGATDFTHRMAKQFKLPLTKTRAGLVPLTFENDVLHFCKSLSGVSLDVEAKAGKTLFRESMIFTHRGLSGPAILQISSYLKKDQSLSLNLLPAHCAKDIIHKAKEETPKTTLKKILSEYLPKRLVLALLEKHQTTKPLGELPKKAIELIANDINAWTIIPAGTEGYGKAEVTIGGVSTHALSSKTMEARTTSGLYIIGEAVDVTGWLGGYNLQWAWSSGWAAGSHL